MWRCGGLGLILMGPAPEHSAVLTVTVTGIAFTGPDGPLHCRPYEAVLPGYTTVEPSVASLVLKPAPTPPLVFLLYQLILLAEVLFNKSANMGIAADHF